MLKCFCAPPHDQHSTATSSQLSTTLISSQDGPKANDAQQVRPDSKKAKVLDLIRRPEGASVKEIMEATGWLAHSVHGFVSGGLVKKMALKVESITRESGDRAYHLAN